MFHHHWYPVIRTWSGLGAGIDPIARPVRTLANNRPIKATVEAPTEMPMLRVSVDSGTSTEAPRRPRAIAIASAAMTRTNTAVQTQNISHQRLSILPACGPAELSTDWIWYSFIGAPSVAAARVPCATPAL